MLANLMNGFLNFLKAMFCFFINMMLAVIVSIPVEQGGLGWPGFFGVLVFLLLLFLFVKVSKIGSSVLGIIGYIVLRTRLVGTEKITKLLESKEFIYLIALVIGYFVLTSYLGKSSGSDNQAEAPVSKPKSNYPTLEVTYRGKKHYVEIIQAGQVRTGDIIRGHRDGYDRFKFSRVTVGPRYVDHKDDPVVEILFEDGVWYKISIYDEYQRMIS